MIRFDRYLWDKGVHTFPKGISPKSEHNRMTGAQTYLFKGCSGEPCDEKEKDE